MSSRRMTFGSLIYEAPGSDFLHKRISSDADAACGPRQDLHFGSYRCPQTIAMGPSQKKTRAEIYLKMSVLKTQKNKGFLKMYILNKLP